MLNYVKPSAIMPNVMAPFKEQCVYLIFRFFSRQNKFFSRQNDFFPAKILI
jgi:hypothetical protein